MAAVPASPYVLGIGTSVPPYSITQTNYAEFIIKAISLPDSLAAKVRRLSERTAIEKRHFIADDMNKPRGQWDNLGNEFPTTVPGMTRRNGFYKEVAPILATMAAKKALQDWGGAASDITHVVSVSCTGVMAPGIEYYLMQELGLPASTQRFGINLMGCFGGFRGLALARTLALEDARHRVLVVCTEICSVHFQAALSMETFVGNALFADGASAVVVGSGTPRAGERPLLEICKTASLVIEDTPQKMTWEASDHGFVMKLSIDIPASLKAKAPEFARTLLGPDLDPASCWWPLHPGGKQIIEGIEEACHLQRWQTNASWQTLANYGNLSSATFYFVLERLRTQSPRAAAAAAAAASTAAGAASSSSTTPLPPVVDTPRHAVGIGFGPGLSLEGCLLRILPADDVFFTDAVLPAEQPLGAEAAAGDLSEPL